ncbi:MAG: glycoside hydrolase family protein [Muribaculaceae bacterium]|nr:glycoside hydrolase family protein [Muribaculaceae bacterium]
MFLRNIITLCCTLAMPGLGATINLSGPGDSHIFEGVPCSEVDLSQVTVGGKAFDPAVDRLSIYGNGAIVIADGWSSPLIIYKEENCTGEQMVLECDRFYRSEMLGAASTLPEYELGSFDNAIKSFRLKRGFSCTLANNPDGTGYSRVFIADNEDLVVDTMPDGLCFASFVRVCRHDWVGKRGISGGDIAAITRSSWFYDWGAAASSTADYEYVPMRHNRWWDSWENIGSRTATSAVLGFNEPDHADQSDLGTEIAIAMWPEMMKSGLRIGSPAPDNINKAWLHEFLAKADSLNYRVDFVATHMYWDSQDPYRLANDIANLCRNTYGGRPMWITEWNNGANWTNESWPNQKGSKRDADFNIVYDENGKSPTVARPHTKANSDKQVEWLTKALDAFDRCEWLERHAFYNWVEDARALELDGKLTPAGKLFAAFNSRPAFNRATEYVHLWRPAPPLPTKIRFSDGRVRIDFTDTNGETAKGYIVERRINGGEWVEIALTTPDEFRHGINCYFRDFDIADGLLEYRFKALSYKDTESIYSRILGVKVQTGGIAAPEAGPGTDVYTTAGKLVIEADADGSDTLFGIDGRAVRRLEYHRGINTYDLPAGFYIVRGQKIAIAGAC